MNKEQFIYWLKGFTSAIDLPTSGQWDTIVSELEKIKDCPDYGSPIEEFKPNPLWQEPHYQYPRGPHYQYPSDINKVTCENGTLNSIGIVGSGDSLSTISTNGNTSITTKLFPGTTLNYTVGNKE